jgi:outer membrane lipase/esterase
MTSIRAATLATLASLLLAACGGGTQQQEAFVPQRYFAFGDDASAFTSDGRKYSINGLDSNNVRDCNQQPLWIQQIAGLYGFVFAQCNPENKTDIRAKTLAFAGAKVADVAAQIDAQQTAGGFRDKDLATVFVGINDVLELYAQYPARSEASLLAEARARGERIAQAVNRLIDLGSKVVVASVPDVGLTPFAVAQKAAFTDIDRAALMTRLTTEMNNQLGVKVLLDGRFVGLAQVDLRFAAIGRAPLAFGFANITEGVCTTPLPDCTTATVATGNDPNVYLWADATRLSPAGHSQLATLAVDRAQRNPF